MAWSSPDLLAAAHHNRRRCSSLRKQERVYAFLAVTGLFGVIIFFYRFSALGGPCGKTGYRNHYLVHLLNFTRECKIAKGLAFVRSDYTLLASRRFRRWLTRRVLAVDPVETFSLAVTARCRLYVKQQFPQTDPAMYGRAQPLGQPVMRMIISSWSNPYFSAWLNLEMSDGRYADLRPKQRQYSARTAIEFLRKGDEPSVSCRILN